MKICDNNVVEKNNLKSDILMLNLVDDTIIVN